MYTKLYEINVILVLIFVYFVSAFLEMQKLPLLQVLCPLALCLGLQYILLHPNHKINSLIALRFNSDIISPFSQPANCLPRYEIYWFHFTGWITSQRSRVCYSIIFQTKKEAACYASNPPPYFQLFSTAGIFITGFIFTETANTWRHDSSFLKAIFSAATFTVISACIRSPF